MNIQNPLAVRSWSLSQLLVTVWFVAATVLAFMYLKGTVYNGIYNAGVKAGSEQGFQTTVASLMKTAGSCEPITVKQEGKEVNLINIACLQTSGNKESEASE